MATVYEPIRYGWGLVYWLTIEGVPVTFCERALTLTTVSGFSTEDASLVVDKSGALGTSIDRQAGLARGTPFRWSLRDTSTVRAYFKQPTYYATLSADATSSATTLTVTSTSGWPSSGALYAGAERITYSGTTATTFTGCTRAVAGKAYPLEASGASALLTDVPRWWLGREVKLYAKAVTPTGATTGSAWTTDAELIWRGFVHTGPTRDGALWQFEALPMDRLCSRPLAAEWTGTLDPSEIRIPAPGPLGRMMSVSIAGYTSGGASVYNYTGASAIEFDAFDGYAAGTLMTPSEIRASIKSAFDSAVSGIAELTAWHWYTGSKVGAGYFNNGPEQGYQGLVGAYIEHAASSNTKDVKIAIAGPWGGILGPHALTFTAGIASSTPIATGWASTELMVDKGYGQPSTVAPGPYYGIDLDEGDPDAAPAPGKVKIGGAVYSYTATASANGKLFLNGLTLDGKGVNVASIGKQDATIVAQASGTTSSIILQTLLSSGESALRDATWDTLAEGQGYGIAADAVDVAGLPAAADKGWLALQQLVIAHGSRSLQQIIGGLLALSGKALAMRQIRTATNRAAQIAVVDTSPVGSDYVATITDTDLLSRLGEPVDAGQPPGGLNRIMVKGSEVDGAAEVQITISDRPAVMAAGAREASFEVPIGDRDGFVPVVKSWASARFARDHVSQVLSIRVGPWIDAQVGDVVRLSLTHHRIWQWSSGAPGYTGQGRVLGRSFDLSSGVVELELLVDGSQATAGLCPSAQVVATGVGTFDVAEEYEPILSAALTAAAGDITLIHYRPGQVESTATTFDISAATVTGGVCRCTISSGSPTLTPNSSRVTWPASASDDDYQALYMHDADGTRWA